jgi:hypothetical protein
MTPDEVAPMLEEIARNGIFRGAPLAVLEMSTTFQRGVSAVELSRITSPRGPGKAHGIWGARAASPRTPAPEGGPPALVSGNLRGSSRVGAVVVTAAASFCSVSWYAVYAAFQEFGGVRGGKSAWLSSEGWEFRHGAVTPEHPYVRPAVERMAGDGSLTAAAIRGWEAADVLAPYATGS